MTSPARRCSNRASRLAREVDRVIRWRKLNPGAWHVAQHLSADDTARVAEREAFAKCHEHTCMGCKGTYLCANACDPIGEGLKNSICNGCFDKEVSKV